IEFVAKARWIATGHETRPTGTAIRGCYVAVGEAHAVLGDRVDVRRRNLLVALEAEFAIADIVRENDDHIRLLVRSRNCRREEGDRRCCKQPDVESQVHCESPEEATNQGRGCGSGYHFVLGVGIEADTAFRQATSLAYSSAVLSRSFSAKFVFCDSSARRLYSSFLPSSKNSMSFQSPERTAPAGVVRHVP